MEKLQYTKPQSEIVALSNQSALLAGSVIVSPNPLDPTKPSLISKRRYTGSVEIDPASWDYALWNDKENDVDTDDY